MSDPVPPATSPAQAFRRYDETPDAQFYVAPRFVTHIDDGAVAAVTALYRELLPALDDAGHAQLVAGYARAAGGFDAAELRAHRPRRGDPLYGVVARRAVPLGPTP